MKYFYLECDFIYFHIYLPPLTRLHSPFFILWSNLSLYMQAYIKKIFKRSIRSNFNPDRFYI